MAKEKIKVYTYTRVSTAMQIDGYSLDAQKSRMKAFAEFNDYEIAHEYEDAGKSGKSIEGRTQFNQMMEAIKTGKDGVSFVLVFKLSRFGRNAADVLSTLQVMQDFGVNLICVEDGIGSSKDAGKLMISVLSAVAEIERENIRVQTMEGRIQKAREGKWNGGFAPYGYKLVDGKLEIISGHHRVKSARAAEMKEIIAIVDVSGLSRSKIAAKQLAHNAISGFDDDSTLREIVKMIDDVDDMIESFVGKEIMEEPLEQYDKMLSPAVQFDFKNVTFTFLPHQVKDMDALVKDLESKAPDIVGVASYEQCKGFVETLSKYQKFTDIRNVGAAIHSMIENAAQKMDDCGFTEEGEWTYLAKLFGSNAVPGDSASVIQQAIKKAEKEGTITSKNRWQLIEYLCADYLSGR